MDNIILISIPESTIQDIVEKAVSKALAAHESNAIQPERKVVDLNGLLEARPIIGSRSTIYKKVYRGLIPSSKRGKKLYFNLDEIDEWLLVNKVKSAKDIQKDTEDYLRNKVR